MIANSSIVHHAYYSADLSLCRTVLTMYNHVTQRLLPPNKRLQYKPRPRNHNLTLIPANRRTMTVVILLLACFSGRPIDFHTSLHNVLLLS